MYLDYILFAIGIVCFIIAIILLGQVIHLKRNSSEEKLLLSETTEKLDVFSTLRGTEPSEVGVQMQDVTAPTGLLLNTDLGAEKKSSGDNREIQWTDTIKPQTEDNSSRTLTNRSLYNSQNVWLITGPGSESKPLDVSPLMDKYDILSEITSGGMSRIFKIRNKTLGNIWIAKFIETWLSEAINEEDVLKQLNHINLPQIIDVFKTDQGVFLVESFIEGYSMESLMIHTMVSEEQTCEWGIEMAQVLNYLHTLDARIIHCDMKPSNIMITHDNKLVLIDFGISKLRGGYDGDIGITLPYAAPEQFKGEYVSCDIAKMRFGADFEGIPGVAIDERTDLYSLGVILYQLIMGEIPKADAVNNIYSYASNKMAEVITKCLELNPENRYQSAAELIEALQDVQRQKTQVLKRAMTRRIMAACCAVAVIGGVGSTASGAYINWQETVARITMEPSHVAVTEQQGIQLVIEKEKQNGKAVQMDPSKFKWTYSEENIARMDGDRLVGLNVGETTMTGRYRNKEVSVDVEVTEPIEGEVEVSLRYKEGVEVTKLAGSGERDQVDGDLASASFVSPEHLTVAEDNTIYLSDSGVLRVIKDNMISTIPLEPDYLTAEQIREHDGAVYVLTGPWQDDDDAYYYGILRIEDGEAKVVFYTEADWTVITDFQISKDGVLWFVQQNMGTGMTTLNTLNEETTEPQWIVDLPDGTQNMCIDDDNNIYLTVPEEGSIIRFDAGAKEWKYFAGLAEERNFIDGTVPEFYRPTSIAATEGGLYVLDFDTIRKIKIQGNEVEMTETIAGIPVNDTNAEVKIGSGTETVFATSELASIAVQKDGSLLLSDPKNSVIYLIE